MSNIIVGNIDLSTINNENPKMGKAVVFGRHDQYQNSYSNLTGVSSTVNVNGYTEDINFTNPFVSNTAYAITQGASSYHIFTVNFTTSGYRVFQYGPYHNTSSASSPSDYSFAAIGELA